MTAAPGEPLSNLRMQPTGRMDAKLRTGGTPRECR